MDTSLYRPANDPRTANDPQIGPEMIPGTEMIASPRMEKCGLTNLDSGSENCIIHSDLNTTAFLLTPAKCTVFERFEYKFPDFKNDTQRQRKNIFSYLWYYKNELFKNLR